MVPKSDLRVMVSSKKRNKYSMEIPVTYEGRVSGRADTWIEPTQACVEIENVIEKPGHQELD